ncbi:p-cumate 2,3-dioxygenase ferredoxin subunit [Rhizorhabdus histidinilytica]|jgi:p-cumate 2,3-dioxygenase ferredoxin subunit|uniref:p-cumate 2,3-dioxygenase ferredoxin subunit n=1 Tax=Rhizorhabdus histidinilytica TaxID=439228 RepID=A0A1T5BJF9_9SPHN|nr:p-cumate 2,3-dioxygenase ferredoxin subunit [Rhizorhabdus histidinilytica]
MATQETGADVTIRLCATDDIPEGEVRQFAVDDGRTLAVYRLDGDYFATDDLCTHGDASLSEGEIEDGKILCPYHMGSFDIRTGEACAAPCSIAIRTYKLAVDGDDVLLLD